MSFKCKHEVSIEKNTLFCIWCLKVYDPKDWFQALQFYATPDNWDAELQKDQYYYDAQELGVRARDALGEDDD